MKYQFRNARSFKDNRPVRFTESTDTTWCMDISLKIFDFLF